jgi:hypothetical protein
MVNKHQPPRPVRIEGDVAYILLTRGHEAVIDAVDLPLVNQFRWAAKEDRFPDGSIQTIYVHRTIRTAGRQSTEWMHRVLTDAPRGLVVDHIDGNGLNNRRSNLRVVTHAQNCLNRRISRNNTAGLKGVTQRGESWLAQISLLGRRIHLGKFDSAAAAHEAYARAAADLHGEFARLD